MRNWGITVIWFSKEQYLPGDEQKAHSHPFFHYIYVLSGKACISIGNQSYDVQNDEFLLTPVGVPHCLHSIGHKGIKVIEIKFHVSDPELCSHVMTFHGKLGFPEPRIRNMLESLIGEGINRESFCEELINLKFLEVLYYLRRSAGHGGPSVGSEKDLVESISMPVPRASDFDGVLLYIDAHLNEPINLDLLAKICRMSKHHFCRNFKEVFGISPIRYLNRKRLSRAKEYMLHSDLNITQIGTKVGFADIHYFSKFFKKHERITPQEFVNKIKPNLYFHLEKLENWQSK